MFLYTPPPHPHEAGMTDTLFQAGTDAVGHLHVQTLRGAMVLTNTFTHTPTL